MDTPTHVNGNIQLNGQHTYWALRAGEWLVAREGRFWTDIAGVLTSCAEFVSFILGAPLPEAWVAARRKTSDQTGTPMKFRTCLPFTIPGVVMLLG